MGVLTKHRTVVLIGKESSGKSQLVSSLTGRGAQVANFRGSTIECEIYRHGEVDLVDTPGLFFQADTATAELTIKELTNSDHVMLVVQGTHLESDLTDLVPIVYGKAGSVVVTFRDKCSRTLGESVLARLTKEFGVPFVAVDARALTDDDRSRIDASLQSDQVFPDQLPELKWLETREARNRAFDHPVLGPVLSGALILVPATLAVLIANTIAGALDPFVQALLKTSTESLSSYAEPVRSILTGRYGLVTMGPLLFVWAVPTVILYALLLATYKASGLLDRLSISIQPVTSRFGLSGRDLMRVVRGFGCNVPAVINTRSCSRCSRPTCITAIAFGSACSYQFGAALAVFSASGKVWLIVPYLTYLGATTLLFTRATAPRFLRARLDLLIVNDKRTFLAVPRPAAVWREAQQSVRSFLTKALPVFFVISVLASLMDWLGLTNAAASLIGPAMGLFHLPVAAAPAVVLAIVRKDGILLLTEPRALGALGAGQVLTAVYLASVLVPCLVTTLTIAREQSLKFAGRLLARQFAAAVIFSGILAWGTSWM